MKHFIYTYREHKAKDGHTVKSVRIYNIYRNVPKLVAQGSDTFVSEFQLVMQVLEEGEILPPEAFEKHEFGGHKFHVPYMLEEAGIAKITRIV